MSTQSLLPVNFKGKLAIVTGGGRGIGWNITRALAKVGCDVIVTYVSKDPTEHTSALAKEHGVKIIAYKCDTASPSETSKLIETAEKDWGKKIDIAVANAGICVHSDTHLHTDEDFENVLRVNTFGPFYLSRALARSWFDLPTDVSAGGPRLAQIPKKKLNKQILFISSGAAHHVPYPQNQASYNASKAGLNQMAKTMAQEWAPYGVSVNTVSPGYVQTDMMEKSRGHPEEGAWLLEWEKRVPVGRFAQPQELGEQVVLALTMSLSGWMTGTDIILDGGEDIW